MVEWVHNRFVSWRQWSEQLRLGLWQPVIGKIECGNWRVAFFAASGKARQLLARSPV